MRHTILALTFLIAIEHVYIAYLEIFLWQKPKGLKVFNNTKELARITAVLAKNQGVYNLFLAAGLFWACFSLFSFSLAQFFLSCVCIAGIVGGMSIRRRIFFIQGLLPLIVLILIYYYT